MTTYQFTIVGTKVLQVAANGSGTVNFVDSDYPIPSGKLPTGLPTNLGALIAQVGENNVKIDYYVAASGMISAFLCEQTINLYATGTLSDKIASNPVNVASFSSPWTGSNGGPIQNIWYPMFKGTNKLLTQLSSNSIHTGSGSGCTFEYYGGWSKAQLLTNTVVTVDLTQYCTTNPTACGNTPASPTVTPGIPTGPSAVPSVLQKYWWVLLIIAIVLILLIFGTIILATRKKE